MNDKTKGTPNPLNPAPEKEPESSDEMLDANPSEPLQPVDDKPSTPSASSAPKKMPVINMRPAVSAMPDIKPAQKTTRPTRSNVVSDFGATRNNPSNSGNTSTVNPSETAPVINATAQAAKPVAPTKPKKKKTGLIVGLILVLLLAIGGVVAWYFLKDINKDDPVSVATQRLIDGEVPENVKVSGEIRLMSNNESSLISSLQIDLDSELNTNSFVNSSEAKLIATLRNKKQISVGLEGVYAANKDLYLKIDDLMAAIEEYTSAATQVAQTNGEGTTDNCVTSETGEINCAPVTVVETDCEEGTDCTTVGTIVESDDILTESFEELANIAENLDGVWLRISADELSELSNDSTETSDLTCWGTLLNDMRSNKNNISGAYTKNPFVTSTTTGVTLTSKSSGDVYKVVIDKNAWKSFNSSLSSSSLMDDLDSCIGAPLDVDVLPGLYVEVDENYNFTRLYFESQVGDEACDCGGVESCDCDDPDDCDCPEIEDCDCPESTSYKLVVDLEFSYPDSLKVSEPVEYTNFSELVQEFSLDQYAEPEAEGTEETDTPTE